MFLVLLPILYASHQMIHLKLGIEAASRGHNVVLSLHESSVSSSWFEALKPLPENLKIVPLKFNFSTDEELKAVHNELGQMEPARGLEVIHEILTHMSIEQIEQMLPYILKADMVAGDSIMLGGTMEELRLLYDSKICDTNICGS